MKSHFTVEQFFNPRLRTPLGIALAGTRSAFAYALYRTCTVLHAAMPDALERLRVQAVPFLEAFATAWSFSWWQGVILLASVAFGLGIGTRIAAGVLLVFLLGAAIIDSGGVVATFGPWTGVAGMLLMVALCSRWGNVFGGDELVERLR
jgi:hypothetical protein